MEILGDDDEADVPVARPATGPASAARSVPAAGWARDTAVDGSGISRPSAPVAGSGGAAADLDLGEQAPDPQREGADPWRGPATGPLAIRPAPPPFVEAPVAVPGDEPADEPEPEAGFTEQTSGLARLRAVVLAPEALGLAGVVTAVGAAVSALPSVLAFSDPVNGQDPVGLYATTYGLAGLVVVALGVAAAMRIRPRHGAAATALAGAAVVLGVLLVAVAALLTVTAGDLGSPPETPDPGSGFEDGEFGT